MPRPWAEVLQGMRDEYDELKARYLLERSRRILVEADLSWYKARFREATRRGW